MADSPRKASDFEKKWVDQVVRDQRRIYQEWVKTAHHLRRMRALRLSGRTPRAFQAIVGRGVRVPMSWALVQTVVGMIAKNKPAFKRIPVDEADKERAMRLQTSAWPLIETYSRMAKKPLYYLAVDQLAGDGRAVAKLHRRVLEGYPVRAEGIDDKTYNKQVEDYLNDNRQEPFRVSLVDPTTFWPSREEFDASYVVESGRKPLLSTLKGLGLKFGTNNDLVPAPLGSTIQELEIPGGMSPTSMVNVVTTDNEIFVDIDGHTMRFPNELGFINYSWRGGQVSSINDPMLEATSVIFPFAGVEPWLNTLMSVLLSWSILGGTPILAVHTSVDGAAVRVGDETPPADIPLGKMVSPGAGKTLQFVQPPPVGREVLEAIEMLMSIYEKAGITSMRRGFIGTRTPGLTFGSALEAAGDMFAPLVAGAEGILEDIVTMTWRACDELDIPMWVTGHGLVPASGSRKKVLAPWKIDPKDIHGYYDLHCELKLSNLQDTINRGMHGAFMKQHGLWSKDRSMEWGGVEDPSEEDIQIFKDKLKESPLYQEQVLRQALAEDPTLGPIVEQAEASGVSLIQLLQQGTTAMQAAGAPAGAGGGGSAEPAGEGQIRGMPAPSGGGRSKGQPRRPTGPRQTKQGQQFQ